MLQKFHYFPIKPENFALALSRVHARIFTRSHPSKKRKKKFFHAEIEKIDASLLYLRVNETSRNILERFFFNIFER